MKKIYILIAVLFATTQFSQAQYRLAKGDKQFNIAAGGSTYGSGAGFLGTIGLDFGIHKDVSIGGELSLRATTQSYLNGGGYYVNGYYYNNNYNYSYTTVILGASARGDYHFNSLIGIPTKWDLYAGANLGLYIFAYPNYYDGNTYYTPPVAIRPGIGLQTGGRYYFTKSTAINAEIGFTNAITLSTMAYLKIGASFAF